VTVSYTHLDVYKRQPITNSPVPWATRSISVRKSRGGSLQLPELAEEG